MLSCCLFIGEWDGIPKEGTQVVEEKYYSIETTEIGSHWVLQYHPWILKVQKICKCTKRVLGIARRADIWNQPHHTYIRLTAINMTKPFMTVPSNSRAGRVNHKIAKPGSLNLLCKQLSCALCHLAPPTLAVLYPVRLYSPLQPLLQ